METVACLAGLLVNWVTESRKIKKSVLQDRNKHKHLQTMPQWDVWVDSDFRDWRHSGAKKKKKSNALWPLEQQNGTFMMSPRFFPEIDGLSRNADWLIRRLAECAAVVRLLSCSFSGWNIQPGALGRMTNEEGYGRLRPRLSAGAAAIGHD